MNVSNTAQNAAQSAVLNTDQGVIESKAREDYRHYLGKIVLVNAISGFVGNDSVDIRLAPPAKVLIEATRLESVLRWNDDWLDPYYEVRLIEEHPMLVGVRSLWIHGPCYHLNGKQTEASDIVQELGPMRQNDLQTSEGADSQEATSDLPSPLTLHVSLARLYAARTMKEVEALCAQVDAGFVADKPSVQFSDEDWALWTDAIRKRVSGIGESNHDSNQERNSGTPVVVHGLSYSPEMIVALKELWRALQQATDCGLLDQLQGNCNNPDSINDLCDAVDSGINSAGLQ